MLRLGILSEITKLRLCVFMLYPECRKKNLIKFFLNEGVSLKVYFMMPLKKKFDELFSEHSQSKTSKYVRTIVGRLDCYKY